MRTHISQGPLRPILAVFVPGVRGTWTFLGTRRSSLAKQGRCALMSPRTTSPTHPNTDTQACRTSWRQRSRIFPSDSSQTPSTLRVSSNLEQDSCSDLKLRKQAPSSGRLNQSSQSFTCAMLSPMPYKTFHDVDGDEHSQPENPAEYSKGPSEADRVCVGWHVCAEPNSVGPCPYGEDQAKEIDECSSVPESFKTVLRHRLPGPSGLIPKSPRQKHIP
jgi:hypothetical protein